MAPGSGQPRSRISTLCVGGTAHGPRGTLGWQPSLVLRQAAEVSSRRFAAWQWVFLGAVGTSTLLFRTQGVLMNLASEQQPW